MNTKVSVILAVKNEQLHVEEALRSVLGQQQLDLEVVLVDDSSEDDTFKIVSRIAEGDKRLSVHRNPGRGKVSAFNLGVERSTGAIKCLFAGDDIMPARSLKARVSAFPNEQGAPLVQLTRILIWDGNAKLSGPVVPKERGKGNLSGASMLFNHAAERILFPIPEALPNEDTWLSIACDIDTRIRVLHDDTVACLWRVHAGNTSPTWRLGHQQFKDRFVARAQAYSRYLKKHDRELSEEARSRLRGLISFLEKYRQGDWVGMLLFPVPVKYKLRYLSSATKAFYLPSRIVRNALGRV